jgi:D-glycero-alpha-D-manno-heptose-7-phosphate kinase
VAGEQINNTQKNEDRLLRMRELVDEAHKILVSGTDDFRAFGRLLHESWVQKQKLSSKITSGVINEAYEAAQKAGAIGGKLLGAGAGGFLLFYVEPENQERVREALKGYLHVPFRFDFSGSEIAVYQPDFYTNGNGAGLK